MRCLAKSPADRFASAVEIVAALSDHAAPDGRRARTRRTVATVLVIAVTVGIGAALAFPSRRAPSVGASLPLSASASSAPAPAVTRLVDLAPPQTTVAGAATEYATGMQAFQDNSWFIACAHFAKAVELDPSMAAAHLRLSMMQIIVRDPATRRSEFEKAAGMRARLGERDQLLMEALQPYLQAEIQDVAEADRRLRVLAQRYASDVEIAMWLAAIHYYTPESRVPADRALALDPSDAVSLEFKADALVLEGKFEEARDAYERCGAVALDGAECFAIMSWADMAAGRCADFERNARRAADRSPFWLGLVLWAMASNGAGAEALEETTKQWIPTLPPPFGPEFQRLGFEARLAILAGDFTRASALAKQEAATLAADPRLRSMYWLQLQATVQLIDIALETGDATATRRLASDFVARSGAWPRDAFLGQGVDLSLYFARLTLPTTESAPSDFDARRRAWIDERLGAGAYRGAVWNYAYASTAFTASEARAALDALADLGPRTSGASLGGFSFAGRLGSPEADAGRVYLLAGRVDEAIDHLRRAVAQCDVIPSTVDHVRAELDLGRALERKGERDAACAAYGKVLARWGHARPRSVTADAARARAMALGCGK